jgi:metal-responsive CopG/Arc/MetJ family transcriptional regulator
MAKISIHLDEQRLLELDQLVKSNPHLAKRNRSSLCSYLIQKEAAEWKKKQMLEAVKVLDKLNLGWSEEEENCAVIDAEVFG